MPNGSHETSTAASTAPLALGTIYVQAAGNQLAHYTLSIVELYDVEGLEFSGPEYDYDADIINYTYTYSGTQPQEGDTIKAFALPVFLPTLDEGGQGYVTPLAAKVTNSNDSSETSSTTVKTNTPIIRPAKDPSSDKDSIPEVNELRWLIALDDVKQDDESYINYYFIFAIVKTDTNNIRLMTYEASESQLVYSYQENPVVPVGATPWAAVAFSNVIYEQFDSIVIEEEDPVNISFSDPEPTSFNFEAFGSQNR